MKICTVASALLLALGQLQLASGKTTNFNATFDTLVTLPDEGRFSPVGNYMNFSFTGFNVAQPDVEILGLAPESKPNYAFASGPAEMTVSYPGSKVKSFALTSLYYGCRDDLGQGAVSPAVACTITAKGYKAGSSSIVAASQDFVFSPGSEEAIAPLTFGRFKAAFTGLGNVTYAVSTPATGVNLYVDNVVGTKDT